MPYGGMGAAGEEVSPHRVGTHAGRCESCYQGTFRERRQEDPVETCVTPSVPQDVLDILDAIAGPSTYSQAWWEQYAQSEYRARMERAARERQQTSRRNIQSWSTHQNRWVYPEQKS